MAKNRVIVTVNSLKEKPLKEKEVRKREMIDDSLSSRLEYEANFFDERIKHKQFRDDDLRVKHDTSDYGLLRFLGVDTNLGPLRVLDCGCGTGYSSVLLAKYGMNVSAVDISPKSIEMTKRRAEVNQVTQRVDAQVMALEDLDYNDNTFDLVVGRDILHHVDFEKSAKEIIRVQKPGAKAFFKETSSQNKILMAARRYLTGRFGIPKLRDEIENPISKKDIKVLKEITEGKYKVHYLNFVFFALLDSYVFKSKFVIIRNILLTLDKMIYKYLPFLRRYSYYIVIEFSK